MIFAIDPAFDGGRERVFCPFEQILSAYLNELEPGDQFMISFEHGNDVRGVRGETPYFSCGFTPDERFDFLSSLEEKGVFSWTSDNENWKHKSFRVAHVGYTDHLPVPAKVGNYINSMGQRYYAQGTKIGYVSQDQFYREPTGAKKIEPPFLMPIDFYVRWEDSAGEHLFVGPGIVREGMVIPELYLVGGVIFDSHKSSVFVPEKFVSFKAVEKTRTATQAATSTVTARHLFILLDEEKREWRMNPGQDFMLVNGVRLNYDVTLQILKLACFKEWLTKQIPVISLQRVGDHYILAPEEEKEYYTNVISNNYVSEICGHLVATPDAIAIRVNSKYVKLVSKNSMSCFALSFTYLMNLIENPSLCGFFSWISTLIENGLLVVTEEDDELILSGATAATAENPVEVVSPFFRKMTFKRQNLSENFSNGLALLGIDKTIEKGDGPTHWIVVEAKNGKLYVVYDPITTSKFRVGTDVTQILTFPDTLLVTFDQNLIGLTGLSGNVNV